MTKEELRNKFDGLYAYMVMSKEPKNMMLFGDVMRHMMEWMIENKPEEAEGFIETLCAVKWQQYLTFDEATEIVEGMKPRAAWGYDEWMKVMKDLGLETKRETVYNCYSLWVVMNAVHSDNGNVIASLMGIDFGGSAGNADYIKAVHSFAVNMLTDEDGRYSVRRYFLE